MKRREAPCYNKKFGHNFPYPESICTECGIKQEELNKPLIKISVIKEYKPKKAEKGIHSEMHALAKEISEYCGEPKKFAMYLGIIKNMGLGRAYQIFSEIKQSTTSQKKIKTPGKLFLYMSTHKKNKKNGNSKKTK